MSKSMGLKDIRNTKLLQSIEEFQKTSGMKEEYVFTKELERATFLLPIKKRTKYDIVSSRYDGDKEGTPINFLLIEQAEGSYLPAFTSLDVLRESIQDCDVVPLKYDHLKDIAISDNKIDGFYINPYTLGILINSEVMFYFDTLKENSLYSAKKLLFGEPVDYPRPLISAINNCLKSVSGINKAYFTLMQIDDNIPQFLLVLDGEYEEQPVYDTIRNVTAHMLLPGVILNIVSIDSYIGKQAIDDKIVPIYEKES